MRHAAFSLALLAVLAGCGTDADTLDDPDHVRTWANTISPVAVWAHLHGPISFADGEPAFPDPLCPSIADDGTTVAMTGGCTDETGTTWTGGATVARSGGDRTLTLDGWGQFDDPDFRSATSGTAEVRQLGVSLHAFEARLVTRGGVTTDVEYQGSVEGGYDTATLWNGRGRAARDGSASPVGVVEARTVDELLDDDLCMGQAASGETTLTDGDHTVVLTYDGAVDCDGDRNARWTFDGEERGLVDGIVCSTAAAGSARSIPIGGIFVFVVLATARRRRRARRGLRCLSVRLRDRHQRALSSAPSAAARQG